MAEHIKFSVVAYDSTHDSGYGDNRSRDFRWEDEAVEYAQSLDARFRAVVWKRIETDPINEKIWPLNTSPKAA